MSSPPLPGFGGEPRIADVTSHSQSSSSTDAAHSTPFARRQSLTAFADALWPPPPAETAAHQSETRGRRHFPPNVWTTSGKALRAPHGLVHFAGSEYSPRNFGYVEGALRSGNATATLLVAALQSEAVEGV